MDYEKLYDGMFFIKSVCQCCFGVLSVLETSMFILSFLFDDFILFHNPVVILLRLLVFAALTKYFLGALKAWEDENADQLHFHSHPLLLVPVFISAIMDCFIAIRFIAMLIK